MSSISKKTYLVSKIGDVNVRLLAFQMHLGIILYTVSHLKAVRHDWEKSGGKIDHVLAKLAFPDHI